MSLEFYTHTAHTCMCVCVCVYIYIYIYIYIGFPSGSLVKNPPPLACQCKSHRFNPWIGNIPWKRKWQSTSVFCLGNPGLQKNQTWLRTKQQHTYIHTYIHTYVQMCVSCCRACGILVPHQRSNCCRLHWKCADIITGLLGKSRFLYIYIYILIVVLFIYIYICMFIFFDTSVL